MYIPKHFKEEDKKKIAGFMREYNFAALVNKTKNRYWATHLPFLIREEGNDIILFSHMAKANPQWNSFNYEEVLVIFQQPHAYISPKLYETEVSVPTWNYIAVHAYGVPEIMPRLEQRIELLENTFKEFDPSFKNQWETLPEGYKNDLLENITAFRIKVTKIEGKYKLSQNRTEQERKNIIDTLTQSADKTKFDIGKHMSEKS